jgi:hypothetical protein
MGEIVGGDVEERIARLPTPEQMAGLSTAALKRLRDELGRAYCQATVYYANRQLAENYERERP